MFPIQVDVAYRDHDLYLGDGIPNPPVVQDIDECADLCGATSGCTYWTYFHKLCYLKNSDVGRNDTFTGYISGNRACATGKGLLVN